MHFAHRPSCGPRGPQGAAKEADQEHRDKGGEIKSMCVSLV